MPQQRRGSWSSSEKPAARFRPEAIAAPLGGHARVLLFCLASDTDWEGVGVTHATAHQMFVRGLVDRDQTAGRFKLTPLGRDVLAALLKPPVDEQDG